MQSKHFTLKYYLDGAKGIVTYGTTAYLAKVASYAFPVKVAVSPLCAFKVIYPLAVEPIAPAPVIKASLLRIIVIFNFLDLKKSLELKFDDLSDF